MSLDISSKDFALATSSTFFFFEKRSIFLNKDELKRQEEFETQEQERSAVEKNRWDTYNEVEDVRTKAQSHIEERVKQSFLTGWYDDRNAPGRFSTASGHVAYAYAGEIRALQGRKRRLFFENSRRVGREIFKIGNGAAIEDRETIQKSIEMATEDRDNVDAILSKTYGVEYEDPPGKYIKSEDTIPDRPKTMEELKNMSPDEIRRSFNRNSFWAIDWKISDAKDYLSQKGFNSNLERTKGRYFYEHQGNLLRKAIKKLEKKKERTGYLENKSESIDYVGAVMMTEDLKHSDGSNISKEDAKKYVDHFVDTGNLHPEHEKLLTENSIDAAGEKRAWTKRIRGRMRLRNAFGRQPRGKIGELVYAATQGQETRKTQREEIREKVSNTKDTIQKIRERIKAEGDIKAGTVLRFDFNTNLSEEFFNETGVSINLFQLVEVSSVKSDEIHLQSQLDPSKILILNLEKMTLEHDGKSIDAAKFIQSEPQAIEKKKMLSREKDRHIASELFDRLKNTTSTKDSMNTKRNINLRLKISKKAKDYFNKGSSLGLGLGEIIFTVNNFDNRNIMMYRKGNSGTKNGKRVDSWEIDLTQGKLIVERGSVKKEMALSEVLDDSNIAILKS